LRQTPAAAPEAPTISVPFSSGEERTTAPKPSILASNVITRMRASIPSPARNAPYRELGTTGQSGCPIAAAAFAVPLHRDAHELQRHARPLGHPDLHVPNSGSFSTSSDGTSTVPQGPRQFLARAFKDSDGALDAPMARWDTSSWVRPTGDLNAKGRKGLQ
jgi:hypothetical protein